MTLYKKFWTEVYKTSINFVFFGIIVTVFIRHYFLQTKYASKWVNVGLSPGIHELMCICRDCEILLVNFFVCSFSFFEIADIFYRTDWSVTRHGLILYGQTSCLGCTFLRVFRNSVIQITSPKINHIDCVVFGWMLFKFIMMWRRTDRSVCHEQVKYV